MRTSLAVALVLVSHTASAQVVLTEAEALARLSPDSPRVRAIRAAIDVARAEVQAAGRWPNPRITFDRESVVGTTEYLTLIGQPLPISGQRGLQIRAASTLVEASERRADDELRRARADVRLVFTQLVGAQTREQTLAAARDRLRELVDVLAKRENAGDAAGFDRLRAERELLEVDADRASAAGERVRAQALLASFFGDRVDPAQVVARHEPPPTVALPAVDALVARAESTRGELQALAKEIQAAQFSAQAADRRRVPEPELIVGTKSSSAIGGDVGSVITVQATIPLFDHGRAERAQALARASQAEARAAALRAALRVEIAGWHGAVLERRSLADRYRTAVSGAGEIERIAQVSYDAGERGILELLDAHRTTAAARVRQATLDASVRQAEIELEFLSGWEIRP